MQDIAQSQRERLAHIDFRLYFLGSVGRIDLVKRFGIKEAAATRDISAYKELAEANLDYDTKAKLYVVTDQFTPLFDYRPDRVLSALSLGFGDDFAPQSKPYLNCETPSQLNKPNLNTLAAISRAIYNKTPLSIEYRSIDNGLSQREIVPFSLVDNGLRWHVRAYDRKRARFTDFVITRITNPAKTENAAVGEHELQSADNQWNRIVELKIVAHPKLPHKETIELDYGMQDGVLNVNVRAAVAGYLLRRWNVDCTAEAKLDGDEYHLWLKNRQALYGVDNLKIAPGYEEETI